MKVVHLNTHSYGGAAVSARRIHRAALSHGVDSVFITKYGLPSDSTPGYIALKDARVLYFFRRISSDPRLYRVGKLVQRAREHPHLVNRPAGFEIFSPLNTGQDFADCLSALDPDVIHLHWIAGFVDHDAFFRLHRNKKFVWTLKDMNPITGGCHHSDGCMKFTADCRACPQLVGTIDPNYSGRVLAEKIRSLSHVADDQMTIVAPSKWLLELSMQSPVTKRFRHVHIENPSWTDSASIDVNARTKAELGLPNNKKIVLFVSDNLRNPRKGVDMLFEAVRAMARRDEVHLVGLGQATDRPRGLSASFPGTVRDETTRARYFACADVLVSPSVAENASIVVIEALTCGTPVVAFKVGGTPELVDAESGAIAEPRTAEALAAALDDVLFQRSFDRAGIKERAARFAPATVWEKYHQVYSELLART